MATELTQRYRWMLKNQIASKHIFVVKKLRFLDFLAKHWKTNNFFINRLTGLVKVAIVSGRKVGEICGATTTVTTTERIHTLDPSNRSATDINNTRVLKKQNKINFSIEGLEASKELNKT